MNFLIDTQLAIWALFDDPRLSQEARLILDDKENRFQFSVCTIWEIAIKRGLNKAGFQHDPREIRRHLIRNGCTELLILSEHVIEAGSLPLPHKDPFDRLLVAQAKVEGITLLTADPQIARYSGSIKRV
jgi:PIN domain nuclease of toxin-antitoxin system